MRGCSRRTPKGRPSKQIAESLEARLDVAHGSMLERHSRKEKRPAFAGLFHCDIDGLVYFAAINAKVVSSMRLLKPHSLSYQLNTFTMVPPITRVCVLSYTELRGS